MQLKISDLQSSTGTFDIWLPQARWHCDKEVTLCSTKLKLVDLEGHRYRGVTVL